MSNQPPPPEPAPSGEPQKPAPPAGDSAASRRARLAARRQAAARRRRVPLPVIIGLVLVAVLAAGALSARPVWRMIKRHRAMGFLEQCDKLVAEEKWVQAFSAARSAEQLSPLDPQVIRYIAKLHARLGLEQGFGYFDRLLALPGATARDREDYASLALTVGNPEIASGQLDDLLDDPKPSARTLLLGSQLASLRRDPTNAVRLAREAVRVEPANPTNALLLAGYLVKSAVAADRAEGRKLLWPVGRADGPLQVPALGAILESAGAERAEREEVEALLRAKPNRTINEELVWYSSRVALDPSSQAKLADEVVERYGRGSVEQIAAAAAWLNRQQLHARTRDILLPELALTDPRLFNLRHAALMALRDVRGAYDFIVNDKAPGDPLQVEMLRCSTALQLKDQNLIDSHFHALIEHGKKNLRSLRIVADYAFRNGQRGVAVEAFQILIKNRVDSAKALAGLTRISDAKGETWNAREYARKLAELRKDDEDVRLQVAYYDLLLKENLDAALELLERLHRAQPENFNRRVALALAYLRKNQAKLAVDLLEGQMVSWPRTLPGVRAIVAATYYANDRISPATNMVARLPLHLLKPEERELVRPVLALNSSLPPAAPESPEETPK